MATLSAKYPHTPSLKRSRIEQVHNRLTSSLATTRRLSPTRSQITLESASTLSQIQIAPSLKEDCTAINTLIDQLYKEDDLLSTKQKEKRNHSHRYEQQQPRGQIMVDKAIPIPKIVRDTYLRAQTVLGEGKVNFLQGLLEECGFIYYAVERNVFFFDLDNFSQNDEGYELELPERPLSALFGIQQLRLGKPYLGYSRQVLLFFQPYEAQLFEFEVREGSNKRKFEFNGVETRLPLPRKRVQSLIITKQGILYCPDENGHLCIIRPQSSLPWTKKELSIKRLPESLKALWKGTAKQLTSSLRHFGKAIRNYTTSFFSEKEIPVSCFYDPHRRLIFVLVGRTSYQLRIYQEQSGKMSCRLTNDELLGKTNTDTVLAAIAIDPSLNSQYNAALYLSSGKRLYLDLTADSIRSIQTVKSPNIQSKNMDKIDIQRLTILKECYAVHLRYAERRWNCCITEDMGNGKPQKIHGVELEMLGGPKDNDYQLLHREREKLGPGKSSLICERSDLSISHEWIRQVFFSTQEFILTTDQSSQRVRILRPIDIFYSLLIGLSHSAQLLAALPYAFSTVSPIQMVSLCIQILTDQEGHYILSPSVVYYYRRALYLPNLPNYIQYKSADFFSIDKEQRKKVLELIIDLSCEGDRRTRAQKEQMLAEGVMTYIARLFRGVMTTQISRISCDCCRVAINSLVEIRGLIQKLTILLRGDEGMALKQVLGWIERARQLFMIVSTLPTLPLMTFTESMSADPSIFHTHLFSFLTRNCQTPITDELSQALPLYCSPNFVRMYRLYNQIRIIKDSTTIVNICTQHMPLPPYMIDYLQKSKNIYELRNEEIKDIKIVNQDSKQLIKLAAGLSTKLHEKEILLERATDILKEEKKNTVDHEQINKLSNQIVEMKQKIKMQTLLKNAYTQHQHLKNSRLTQRLSGFIRKTKKQSKQSQIIFNLQRCLFDAETLLLFAESLALSELKAAHTAIFNLPELPSALLLLAEQAQAKHHGDTATLVQQYKKLINYLLVNSKIHIPVELLLSVYVEIMMKMDEIKTKMAIQDGILQDWLWWPFWWLAEIGQSAVQIYHWIQEKQKQLDLRNDEGDQYKKIYLKAGYYYIVKEYLPSHRSQIAEMLELQAEHPLLIKVNILLLSLSST